MMESLFWLTYVVGVWTFAVGASHEYQQRAARAGLGPCWQDLAGTVAAMAWPINVGLTIGLLFRGRR